ncbi:MAG: hypothetical protein AAF399_30280 [Bacteroidota bacterium]
MTQSIKCWSTCLVLALIVFSCARDVSENVNQDSIFTEYRLVNDADQDKTFARATFRFGGATGTILDLTDPAVVTLDGDLLTYKPLFGYFEKDFAGELAGGTFSYTDLDNSTFENAVSLSSAISLPTALDSISQGEAFSLEWLGDPVGEDESVIVTINGINEGDAQIFTTTDQGANAIVLAQNKLTELGIGEARVFIERWTNQELGQATGEGGAVWSRYITGPMLVQITE